MRNCIATDAIETVDNMCY